MVYYSASIIDHDSMSVQVKNVYNSNMSLLVEDTTFVKLSERASSEIRKALNEGKLAYILKSAIYPDSEVKISHINIKDNSTDNDIEIEKRKAIRNLRLKYEQDANQIELLDTYKFFSDNAALNIMNIYPTPENINSLIKKYEDKTEVLELLVSFKNKNRKLETLYKTKELLQKAEDIVRDCDSIEKIKEAFQTCRQKVLSLKRI